MKSTLFFISTVILFGFLVSLEWNKPDAHKFPQPKETSDRKKEGEEHNREREAFIEKLHRCAPGTSWRAIEMENRLRLNHARSAKYYQNGRTTATADTIAGDIIGEWQEVGAPNQAGRIIVADYVQAIHKVYAVADGGSIWKGNEDGTGWECLNNSFEVENAIALRVLPNPNTGGYRILVAVAAYKSECFFYSDDEGITWQTPSGDYPTIVDKGGIYECVVANDAARTIYLLANGTTEYALYKSVDNGTSFTLELPMSYALYGSTDKMDIWTDEDGSGDLYLLSKNKCYKYLNNDFELQGTFPTLPSTDGATLNGAEIGGNVYLYARYDDNGTNRFYISSNAGVTWTARGTVSGGMFMHNSFGCSSVQPDLLYVGNVDCYRSSNSGLNWAKINNWYDYYDNPQVFLHADIPCIRSYATGPSSEITLITTDGGIYISYDKGLSVTNITMTGMYNAQYYDTYTHRLQPHYVWAGAQDQGFQRAKTAVYGMRNFTQLISGDYGQITSSNNGNSIWTNYPGFTMYYDSYTQNGSSAEWDFTCTGNLWIPPLMADPNDNRVAYLAGGSTTTGTHMFRLSYSNQQITASEGAYNFGTAITALGYSPINKDFRFAVNESGDFFLSSNAGTNWNNQGGNLPAGHYFYGNAMISSSQVFGRVWVGGSGYSNPGVYVSDNFGATFTAMSDSLPATLVYDLAITPDENLIFAATDAGPYVWKKADNRWYYLGGQNAPSETYWSVEYIPAIHTARFATYGRGIWDFVFDPTMYVSVPDVAFTGNISLFPNPSNGEFTLKTSDFRFEDCAFSLTGMNGLSIEDLCPVSVSGNEAAFNIPGLASGVYMLGVHNRTKGWRKMEKVVVR
ncbi:MAG: hypothetical protein K1X92_17940 [Bacteroidia bacterium]|nr:hypothetical protein [Bacteroidia bacterium]